jgi:hypothetical protein
MLDYPRGGAVTQVPAGRNPKLPSSRSASVGMENKSSIDAFTATMYADEAAKVREKAGAVLGSVPLQRLFIPAVLLSWAVFSAWCIWGFPPPVDLPAHGAQLQTLVNLLRGDPDVSQVYEIRVPIGYGLVFWLSLPLAYLTNGAVATRVALWVTLQLFPLSQLALLRAFRRPDWLVLLGLPLAFNFSYWYGLLSGLLAQPLAFFTVAVFQRALESRRARALIWVNLLAAATMQSHLVAFVALVLMLGVLALCHPPRLQSLKMAALALALPIGVSLPKVWSMALRAVRPGPWPATHYGGIAHFVWFVRNYRPEGFLAAWAPLLISAVFVVLYLRRRRREPIAPAAMLVALLALYFITPKTLSGIFLICVRLPVLAAMASLLLVSGDALSKPIKIGVLALSFASLVQTAMFHHRFAREVEGLEEMMAGPPPKTHGYWSLAGREALGSRMIYLEHLGQWLTAKRGGVGHNFFADAEHHPVRFKPGREIPSSLVLASPQELARFDQILLYGDGPLPWRLTGWREIARAGLWRKMAKP